MSELEALKDLAESTCSIEKLQLLRGTALEGFKMKITAIAVAVIVHSALALRADEVASPILLCECRLPPIAIAAVQNKTLPGSVTDDRGILLGGFSDLFRRTGDAPGEFWIVTDRGPNGQVAAEPTTKAKRRTFPIPDFTPMLLHVKVYERDLQLLKATPLVGRSGQPISGRPNLEQFDGGGFNFAGQTPVPFSASGIDPEGLVRMPDGTCWLAEEYRPSLLKVDATGKVLKRFIPEGQRLTDADYAVVAMLPAIYAHRQDNRGFEGLAVSDDGKTLYAAMQSRLENSALDRSRCADLARILAFDTSTERPVAEYAYRFDCTSESSADSEPADGKIGAVAIDAPGRMLVLEHGDGGATIYRVELAAATNLLHLPCHDATGDRALEATRDLGSLGIKPLAKTLVADLSKFEGLSGKLEGLAVIDRQTLAIVNDNDFGFEGFDAQGRAIPSGKHSSLFILRLPRELER